MKTKASFRPKLSLIIPCYNEENRFEAGFLAIISYLTAQKYSWELLLIDDGSRVPVTKLVAAAMKQNPSAFKRKLPVFVQRLPVNMGKGAAIRFGVEKSRGSYVVFSDIDLSVPIENLELMLHHLKHNALVVASRRSEGSTITVHQPFIRELSGRIFTALSNIICDTGVGDVTCGFKGYTRDVAVKLFAQARINRWVFDSEIVYLARKYAIPVVEMPVSWSNKEGSKVKPADMFQSLVDLVRVRWNDARGRYNKQ